MNARWYIIQVMVSYEDKISAEIMSLAKESGIAEIEEVLVPKEKIFEFVSGAVTEKEKVLFPGYVFVKMTLSNVSRHVISSLGKMASFLGGPNPTPVSDHEMEKIFSKLNESSATPSFVFSVGEKVKICDGPFSSFTGVVEDVCKNKSTLRVSIFVFGQPTPVELNFAQVEKIKE